MAVNESGNSSWWVSPLSLLVCVSLFVASVFSFYVSAESDVFYRSDVVVLEFLMAITSGAAVVFILYRLIFPDEKKEEVKK